MKKIIAYVDGSFNKEENVYGSGVVIVDENENIIDQLKEKGSIPGIVESYQIGGEVNASMMAINYAMENNYDEVIIRYDYMGIEKWATFQWKTNKDVSKKYLQFIIENQDKITINFEKVKAHSNNRFNDLADNLAKEACGI